MTRALLLDAGNTVVFLDHHAVAEVAGLSAAALRDAEPLAKRRYAERLRANQGDGVGASAHEDGWRLFMKTLLETAGLSAGLDDTVDRLRAAHDELNLWRRVPEGLVGALKRIKSAGWQIGIVSNSEGKLPELFEHLGIEDHFEVIVDSHHVGIAKPDPRIFDIALRALKVQSKNAVYAGDIPEVDVDGAHAAGVDAALIDPLGHYPDYTEAPCFDGVAELVDALLAEVVEIDAGEADEAEAEAVAEA